MSRGCLIGLFSWMAFAAGYWQFLHARFPPPYSWSVPLGAGFVMALVVLSLLSAIDAARDASRISRDSPDEALPADGARLVVTGRIRATGPTLRAPFSGKDAVLYRYTVQHIATRKRGRNSPIVRDYYGFALTPTVIESSHGPIQLLGFPLLENFDNPALGTPEARSNATAYLSAATFTEGIDSPELIDADGGAMRIDRSVTGDLRFDDKQLLEQFVADGEAVCGIGCFSAAGHGLRPDLDAGSIRLVRGDPQTAATALRWRVVHGVVGSILLTAMVNGGIYSYLRWFA